MKVSKTKKREMPKTADELEAYLSDKFHRIMMSGDFASYDGFMDDYFRIQDEEDHFPECAFPSEIRQSEVGTGAAGGPSRQWGSAATGNTTHDLAETSQIAKTPSPPITNRGATLYHTHNRGATLYHTHDPAHQQDCTASPETKAQKPKCPHIMGGYDGGVEVGFDGKWNNKAFEKLIGKLEAARTASQIKGNDDRYITLQGRDFMVWPRGAGKDVNYRYVAEGDGIKFYIHHNPQGPLQPIRLRYGFESLIGRSVFRVHEETIEWLSSLGFVIEKETLSRIDLQVMVYRHVREFITAISNNHVVNKSFKWSNHGIRRDVQTFSIGSDIQICIYDKGAETFKALVSDPIKFGFMLKVCFGEEWLFQHNELPVTRVEFRLRRGALKDKGINSMQDLQEIEPALVEWLTTKWFRLLNGPKIRGHENTQDIHPAWREVQEQFKRYFPGVNGVHRDVLPNRKRAISCEPKALIQQAAGCLASAVALKFGKQPTPKQARLLVDALLESYEDELFRKTNERAEEFQVTKGVKIASGNEDTIE